MVKMELNQVIIAGKVTSLFEEKIVRNKSKEQVFVVLKVNNIDIRFAELEFVEKAGETVKIDSTIGVKGKIAFDCNNELYILAEQIVQIA